MQIEGLYHRVIEDAFGQALNGIWAYFQVKDCVPGVEGVTMEVLGFAACEEAFFAVLERLMREGKIKLAKKGQFLKGSIDEQIGLLRDSFPKSDMEVDQGGAGVWFFTDACPAGAVWVDSSGSEVWT